MQEQVVGLDACPVRAVDPERVAATRGRLLPGVEAVRLDGLFRLLGDAGRVRILLEAGERCVCDLAATVDVPDASVPSPSACCARPGLCATAEPGG